MSTPAPDALSSHELGELPDPALIDDLMRTMTAATGGPRRKGRNPFGLAGATIALCVFAVVLAWPVAFSAALAWHLAQAGWEVF